MRTVVALYDELHDANQAVRALRNAGFDQDRVSLIASDARGEYSRYLGEDAMDMEAEVEDVGEGAAAGAGIGAVLGGLTGLLVGLGALAIPGVGPAIAAGPLVSTLVGAGIGAAAGGLIGALVDLGIPEEQAEYYAEGIRRGGTLVVVTTEEMRTEEAVDILNQYNPVDVERRARQWRETGWEGYDREAEPYSERDMDRFRELRGDFRDEAPRAGEYRARYYAPEGSAHRGEDFAGWSEYEPRFRSHYQTTYSGMDYDYGYYMPAYRYGYDLAQDERYRTYDWRTLEPHARREWEERGEESTWEEIKDAVRHAWNEITS